MNTTDLENWDGQCILETISILTTQNHLVDHMDSELQIILSLFQFPREDQHTLDLNKLVGNIPLVQFQAHFGPTMLGNSPDITMIFTIGL